ncbi:MAG: dockerin type I domain-containing protein [Pirellulaceae bacterium]
MLSRRAEKRTLNQRHGQARRSGFRRPGFRRSLQLQKLESRQMLAANPLGATSLDTGEYFLGTVTVTPVFFESDGSSEDHTENWTEQEIDEALTKISDSVQWWSTLLGTITDKHKLEFVIDETYARDPVETRFEPISNKSETFQQYVSDFLVAEGLGDSTSVNHGMLRFNDRQRNLPEHQTDWAFTIFMVDASEDPDGFFDTSGDFAGAFAYSGGLYVITPNSRPTSTVAHEIGHIFWARDEYPGGGSYTDLAGYYNSQNINAFDNPNLDQEPSIMRGGVRTVEAFEQGISSLRTLEFIGWRDSDGDGVFDLADVPLDLDITGYFDAENSTYHVNGSATAVALLNQNSRSFRSDITLNQIDRLEYRLDEGPWLTAQQYDQQQVLIDVAIPIAGDFDSIEFRVVDTIITDAQQEEIITQSQVVSGTLLQPAVSDAAIRGYAFIDQNADGIRDPGETLLASTTATLVTNDGSPLFKGSIRAANFDGSLPSTTPGVSLTAIGGQFNDQVYASDAIDNPERKVFLARNFTFDRFEDAWGESVALNAQFDQEVGYASATVIGLDSGSYGRLEAYDVAGNLLTRTTSQRIAADTIETLTISDPLGRIASIRVMGHARTKIAIADLEFGFEDSVTTDVDGIWQFSNLVPGDYQLQFTAENLIHQFSSPALSVQAGQQSGDLQTVAAAVVDSPRHNATAAFDVDRLNGVTPADILAVINDIADNGTRTLGQDETTGLAIDVSNDGRITPLDILMVINYLSANNGNGEQGELIEDQSLTPPQATANQSNAGRTSKSALDRAELINHGNSLVNSAYLVDLAVQELSQNSLNNGVLDQMLNSAGYSTHDESISAKPTDSQRDQEVFMDSEDSTEQATKVKKPVNSHENDQLTRKMSAELVDLDLLSSAFDADSKEPKLRSFI